MRIAVIGAGAIGCYYGAKLVAGGSNVHFVVRSGLHELGRNGIEVRSTDGDLRIGRVQAYSSPSEIGACDLVIIAVKATNNGALPHLIPPLLRDETALLTLQNGLGNEDFLAQRFGAERVLGGVCFICVQRNAPGVIEHFQYGHLNIGEFTGPARERTHAIGREFKSGGVECGVVENLRCERWRKLVWNIPFNGLAIVAGGVTTKHILSDPPLRLHARALMDEVIAAANQCDCHLAAEVAREYIRRTEAMGSYKPSTLLDFEAGRAIEVEAIWGEPLRQAQAAGARVPRWEELYAALQSKTK